MHLLKELTTQQLDEVKQYVYQTVRFQETYDELYDHILNALSQTEESFSMELVARIVAEDFGGVKQVAEQELVYRKSVTRKYIRLLGLEMLDSFRSLGLIDNVFSLYFCYIWYDESLRSQVPLASMFIGLWAFALIPGVSYLFKRVVLDRKRPKGSIKYDFLYKCWIASCVVVSATNGLFVSKTGIFELSDQHKVLITMAVFFILSVYVRAFQKLYKKRIKVLAV